MANHLPAARTARSIRAHALAGALALAAAGPRAQVTAVPQARVTAVPRARAEVRELKQYGITWTFAQPVVAGRYVNGDWWVRTPAVVTAVDPAPAPGRNGSMLDPPAGEAARKQGQGYDDRIADYQPKAAARFPIELKAGNALISTISVDGSGPHPSVYERVASLSALRTAAVLTAVDEPPPDGSFRPPYCGPEVQHREQDIHWDRLPRLKPVPGMPPPARLTPCFRRLWLDHLPGYESRILHPFENMPDYGREIARATGEAGLVLLIDRPRAELRELMIGYLQLGIDLFGLSRAGQVWWADGGHESGRKWPVLFAGIVLDDDAMRRPGHGFAEDLQTYAGTSWTGSGACFRAHENVTYDNLPPSEWNVRAIESEKYRRCCTSHVWVGAALCARLMGAVELWDHQPFFDYVDRWMTPLTEAQRKATRAAIGDAIDRFPQATTSPDFVGRMWKAYRWPAGAGRR